MCKKRILVVEGNLSLITTYLATRFDYYDENFHGRSFNYNNTCITFETSTYNLLHYILYTDIEFDEIIIGDELETSLNLDLFNEEIQQELNNCLYFPVTLGEICKKTYKKKGKKEPKIIIMSTFFYYPFNGKLSITQVEKIKDFIKSANMLYIDKKI